MTFLYCYWCGLSQDKETGYEKKLCPACQGGYMYPIDESYLIAIPIRGSKNSMNLEEYESKQDELMNQYEVAKQASDSDPADKQKRDEFIRVAQELNKFLDLPVPEEPVEQLQSQHEQLSIFNL